MTEYTRRYLEALPTAELNVIFRREVQERYNGEDSAAADRRMRILVRFVSKKQKIRFLLRE
jgi:hypothetical protein